MGQPGWGHSQSSLPEYIGQLRATRGTETSKYPKEEKSNEIARVAASGSARAQTHVCVSVRALLHVVLRGRVFPGPFTWDVVRKPVDSRRAWKGPSKRVKTPYAKPIGLRILFPSNAGHVKPGMNLGGPPSKAKYSPVTDSGPVP